MRCMVHDMLKDILLMWASSKAVIDPGSVQVGSMVYQDLGPIIYPVVMKYAIMEKFSNVAHMGDNR